MGYAKRPSLTRIPESLTSGIQINWWPGCCTSILAVLLHLWVLPNTASAGASLPSSSELTPLPCEESSTRFFYPVEFGEEGTWRHPEQMQAVIDKIQHDGVTDVYIFIHGWDKTAELAEHDYKDFICRLYTYGTVGPQENSYASMKDAVLIGVFWQSTIFPHRPDPFVLKFITFYPIRGRAEILIRTGFQVLFGAIQDAVVNRPGRERMRLHLIGHSFGGRILLKGLLESFRTTRPPLISSKATNGGKQYTLSFGTGNYQKLFDSIRSLNIMLILAAAPQFEEETIRMFSLELDMLAPAAVLAAGVKGKSEGATRWYRVFNIYSNHDWANRFLFPLGATFSADKVACAIGGCGIRGLPSKTSATDGSLSDTDCTNDTFVLDAQQGAITEQVLSHGIWNINASAIMGGHGDIYKPEVAKLIWALLNTEQVSCH